MNPGHRVSWRTQIKGEIMLKFRKVLLLAAVSVALVACMPKAPDTAADEAALKGELSAWMDAYNAGNAEGVTKLYAEGALLMAPGAAVAVGRPGIFAFIEGDIKKTKAAGQVVNAGEITGVGVDGDTGWLSGTFTVTDGSGATVDTGKFLSVSSRIGGEWLMVRDTWNSDGTAAPATPEAVVEEVFAD
jgi:ketosteroid isomerase-like protein